MPSTTHADTVSASSFLSTLQAVGHFAYCQKGSFAIKVAVYPTERIRMLMQTQHVNKTFAGGSSSFSNIGGTLKHVASEGYFAAWRGLTPSVVRWFPSQSIILFLKDHLGGVLPSYSKTEDYKLWMASKVGAGAATGVINALIWAYPFDVIRQQLATKNSGSWNNAVNQIYSQHGMRGFYRGFVMDAPGLAIFRGVQLGGWDCLKEYYGDQWREMGTFSRFMHGQVISLMGSCCAYPWDTVRRNLIGCDSAGSYSEVFRTGVAAAGGMRRFFYAGFTARVMSSFVNGALLEGFDEYKRH